MGNCESRPSHNYTLLCPTNYLGINGQNPSVLKSNLLYVVKFVVVVVVVVVVEWGEFFLKS